MRELQPAGLRQRCDLQVCRSSLKDIAEKISERNWRCRLSTDDDRGMAESDIQIVKEKNLIVHVRKNERRRGIRERSIKDLWAIRRRGKTSDREVRRGGRGSVVTEVVRRERYDEVRERGQVGRKLNRGK